MTSAAHIRSVRFEDGSIDIDFVLPEGMYVVECEPLDEAAEWMVRCQKDGVWYWFGKGPFETFEGEAFEGWVLVPATPPEGAP